LLHVVSPSGFLRAQRIAPEELCRIGAGQCAGSRMKR